MQLKKVELYNFSSYAGKTSFDFSIQNGKNIILIGGNNGAGKTSLFTAIKLALYGPLSFHYQGKNAQYSARIKELMNHDAFLDAKVKTYVEVELSLSLRHTSSVYTLHREWDYSGQKVQEHYWILRVSATTFKITFLPSSLLTCLNFSFSTVSKLPTFLPMLPTVVI